MQLSRKKENPLKSSRLPKMKQIKKIFYLHMHNNNKTLIKYFFSPLCCTSIFQLVIGLPARWIKSNQNAIKIIKFPMQTKKKQNTKYAIAHELIVSKWVKWYFMCFDCFVFVHMPNSTFGSVINYNFVYVSNKTDSRSSCSPSWSTRY